MKIPLVKIGNHLVGEGQPIFVIAEIGINHNGSLDIAKKLIDGAVRARCNAVKFQKRTPELCVPKDQWNNMRDTPWGRISYIDYKNKIEFGIKEFEEIDQHCRANNIMWFASCWDEPSVDFIERLDPPCYKVASASITNHSLLHKMNDTGRPIMLSTGMSSWDEIQAGVMAANTKNLLIAHSTSTYPCPVEELNLNMITTLKNKFNYPIGYSGHETGLTTTWAAAALGATFIERHITLSHTMWGTDHTASIELHGLEKLVSHMRDVELALGDGVKKVYPSEIPIIKKLRGERT